MTTSPTTPSLAAPTLKHRHALWLISLVALPLLLIFLGTGDPTDMMELFNLIPVREAYRDGHWLMPTLDSAPRLEKPPLPVWLPAILASLFHSESLWLLRLPSILIALLASFATYGIGCVLFDNEQDAPESNRRYALLAALILPAMLFFNREARLASYDIYATGFLTCGCMFLIFLAEIDNASNKRRLLFALGAGLATGLSVLSKGPVPAATVMLPLGLWLVIFHRRLTLFAYIALAALISVLTFMPWLIAIGGLPGIIPARLPNAWKTWIGEFHQFGTGQAANTTAGTVAELSDPRYYYLQMFFWVVPFTPTFIAALLLPFLPSQGTPQPAARERRGRWLFWMLLVGGLLMLTVPSEKKPRYALQLFPYAALLCAAVWQEFSRFPREKSLDLGGRIVLLSQGLFFLVPGVVGIVAVLIVAFTGNFPRVPAVAQAIHSASIPLSLLLFLALTAIALINWKTITRGNLRPATGLLPFCSFVFILTIQTLYKSIPSTHTSEVRGPVQTAVTALPPNTPLYTLSESRPWLPTLYFANQIISPKTTEDLIAQCQKNTHQDIYMVLILDEYVAAEKKYVPMPQLVEDLNKIESATTRHPQQQALWTDENRHTALIKLPATQ